MAQSHTLGRSSIFGRMSKKNIPLRLPEPLYMKSKFIAENTSYSMKSFILERLTEVIEEEVAKKTRYE